MEQPTLVTLLEQSAYQPDSEAFFLAATLLETLSEVWAEGCRQDADECRRLRLAEHLPAPSFDIDQDSVPLPHSTDVMLQVLSSWPVTWVFQHFPPAFRLPASTQASLRNTQRWQDLLPLMATTKPVFRLFTDGSADARRGISGFGVVILLQLGEAIALFASHCMHTPFVLVTAERELAKQVCDCRRCFKADLNRFNVVFNDQNADCENYPIT